MNNYDFGFNNGNVATGPLPESSNIVAQLRLSDCCTGRTEQRYLNFTFAALREFYETLHKMLVKKKEPFFTDATRLPYNYRKDNSPQHQHFL